MKCLKVIISRWWDQVVSFSSLHSFCMRVIESLCHWPPVELHGPLT